jgi:hypothetical protein
MQRRLGKLECVARAVVPPQSGWDLTRLDDDELDELEVLARKAEEANRTGAALVWNADEEEALTRLGAKAHRDKGLAASAES